MGLFANDAQVKLQKDMATFISSEERYEKTKSLSHAVIDCRDNLPAKWIEKKPSVERCEGLDIVRSLLYEKKTKHISSKRFPSLQVQKGYHS